MAKPDEARARLHLLIGRWRGTETLATAPDDITGGAASAVIETRSALGGAIVVQDYQQVRNGTPGFSGHGVLWWDGAAGEYVMSWFDAVSGTPTEYRGAFDGRVLRVVHAAPDGGFSRCTFDCRTTDRYLFSVEHSLDGNTWMATLQGEYDRVAPPAARPASPGRTGRAPGVRAVTSAAALAKAAKAITLPKAAKAITARSNVKAAASRARGTSGTRTTTSRRGRRRR